MLYLPLEPDGEGPHHIELVADNARSFLEGNHVFCSIGDATEQDEVARNERTATVSTHVPMATLLALPDHQRGVYVAEVQERMRHTLSAQAPDVATAIRETMSASPRTFERFTGRTHGLVGGVPKRAGLHNYRDMVPTPVLDGLYMVGDTAFPGQSTLATAIGGVKTAHVVQANV